MTALPTPMENATAVTAEAPPAPPPPTCGVCEYALDGLGAGPCPECGCEISQHDRANWYRWEMFLAFTRRTLVLRWIMLGLIAGASLGLSAYTRSFGFEPPETFIAISSVFLMWWLGARYLPRRGRRGRALHRAWMLAAAWAAALWAFARWMSSWLAEIESYEPPPWRRSWYDDAMVNRLLTSMTITSLVGAAAGVFALWMILRLVRLRPTPAERRTMQSSFAVAMGPQALLVAALVLWRLLDWVQPSWW